MSTVKTKLLEFFSNYKKGYYNSHATRWMHRNNTSLHNEILQETSFLPCDAKIKQRAWHILNDCYSIVTYPNTDIPAIWQGSVYRRYVGVGSHMKDSNCVATKKEKFIDTYGVDNPMKVKKFKQNLESTMITKYGAKSYFISDEGLAKVKAGQANEEIQSARLANIRKTMMRRYGVEYPYQNARILAKSMSAALKYKDYTFPSGRVVKIQGYENRALDELLITYHEDELLIEKHCVPRIKYVMNGKDHYYFPDIFIPAENRLIEVKSPYTYNMQLEKNLLKQAACISQGYLFEFKIYNN